MKKAFATDSVSVTIEPYFQAVQGGDYMRISGQFPINPATDQFVGDDIASQMGQSLTNIRNILEGEGFSMDSVIKTTVLLDSTADFRAMNEVYVTFFAGACLIRTAFKVAALLKATLVEIETVAYCRK